MKKNHTNYVITWLCGIAAILITSNCFSQEKVGAPPSDAIILFDRTNLDQWRSMDGGPATFTIEGDKRN